MTTETMPVQPASIEPFGQADPLRMLGITADLLPGEVLGVRRTRKVRAAVVAGLIVVCALLGAWYVVALVQARSAQNELDQANAAVETVMTDQKKYADVTATKRDLSSITTQLQALMASDLQWSEVVNGVRGAAAPLGVDIASFSGMVGSEATTVGGGGLPSETAQKQIGSLTVTGQAADKVRIAAFVEKIRAMPGVSDPFVTSVTAGDGKEQYVMTINLTDAALKGRFTPTPEATPTTGGN